MVSRLMIDDKIELFSELSDLLWKQRPPKKPPWIPGMEEDSEIKRKILMLPSDRYFRIYILIQYIWCQNISLKLWFALWRKWQHKIIDLVSLLYGDICTIVENWSFQYLFLMVKSIHWILNRRIYIDLYWNRTNIIQRRESVFMMRRSFEDRKKNNRVFTLLIKTSQRESSSRVCSTVLCIILFILFVVFSLLYVYFM